MLRARLSQCIDSKYCKLLKSNLTLLSLGILKWQLQKLCADFKTHDSCIHCGMTLPDEMDVDPVLLFGITACALGLSIFILWGPKLGRRSNGNCSLVGLQNLGLTCFLNSLLQALAACPSFLEWLKSRENNGNVSYSLFNTLSLLCYEKHPESAVTVISPAELIYSLRGKSWPSFPQEQDPHELFLHLISAVEEEEQKAKPQRANSLLDALDSDGDASENKPKDSCHGDTSSLNRRQTMKLEGNLPTASPFRGYLASQLSCLRCGHRSAVVYDKFDTLSLPLPSRPGASFRLSRLLSDFVSAELVDGFSCDSCSPTEGPTQASKAIKIGKLPKCLCLHISRTMIDNSGFMYKRENYVEVPELLPMADYTHTSHMIKEKNKVNGGVTDSELNGVIPSMAVSNNSYDLLSSAINNNNPMHLLKGPVYKLRAVIEHRGTVESGHFVTYRRAPLDPLDSGSNFSESRWYFTSDDTVKKTNLNEVISSSAYLLFYEKCSSLLLDSPTSSGQNVLTP